MDFTNLPFFLLHPSVAKADTVKSAQSKRYFFFWCDREQFENRTRARNTTASLVQRYLRSDGNTRRRFLWNASTLPTAPARPAPPPCSFFPPEGFKGGMMHVSSYRWRCSTDDRSFEGSSANKNNTTLGLIVDLRILIEEGGTPLLNSRRKSFARNHPERAFRRTKSFNEIFWIEEIAHFFLLICIYYVIQCEL
ncbi:hypothetical protein TNCV_359231 [Trichonephila clavipes]|nr:hypothetical protein TNCV_359231 [Trichonephila clavipes]